MIAWQNLSLWKNQGDVIRESGKVLIKNAKQWDNHFRSSSDGICHLNLPDAYAAIKQMYETENPALEDFFEALTQSGLILHTQFDYVRGITTHHFNDNDKLEISSYIPEESGRMVTLIKSSHWRDAVQNMLLCEDVEEAEEVLSMASERKTHLYAPSRESRLRCPVRTVWLGCYSNYFYLNTSYYLDNNLAARGVRRGASVSEQEAPAGRHAQKKSPEERILQPVTKELILPVAKPYISGYDWETFSERIPHQAPALGDVLLAAHKDHFVCEQVTPEFDQKMRELYFPPPPPEKEEK